MTQFNEITSNKIQKLIVILSKEVQSLRKEHIFCLHLILKEIQVLAEKCTIIRQSSSGFHINTVSKAKDLPIERCKVCEFRKCTNLGMYMLYCISSFEHNVLVYTSNKN